MERMDVGWSNAFQLFPVEGESKSGSVPRSWKLGNWMKEHIVYSSTYRINEILSKWLVSPWSLGRKKRAKYHTATKMVARETDMENSIPLDLSNILVMYLDNVTGMNYEESKF